MKPIRIALAVTVLLAPLFAQQVNTNITPASPGLNLGTPTQRWNGNFDQLNVNTLTVNGSGGQGGGGFSCGTTANPGIPIWNGTACVVDTNATDDLNGNFTLPSITTTNSVTTPILNTTGAGFVWNFKTQTAPPNPQSGFMEWYGDSGTNKWSCLNSDGSSCAPAGGGGSLTTSVNSVNLTSQSVLNFNNPVDFQGLHFTFSNPSSGNLTFAVTGTLANAGLANSTMLINGQTCTLGTTLCAISGSSPTTVTGSSDTITAAGTFATQASITAGSSSFIEIRVHGVLTTGAGSPISAMQINAGGTTGICQHSGNLTLTVSQTNVPWDAVCFIHIATTGNPGTAYSWGTDEASTTAGGVAVSKMYCNAATCSAAADNFITTTAQTVSVQETATLVSGESITLQTLDIRAY